MDKTNYSFVEVMGEVLKLARAIQVRNISYEDVISMIENNPDFSIVGEVKNDSARAVDLMRTERIKATEAAKRIGITAAAIYACKEYAQMKLEKKQAIEEYINRRALGLEPDNTGLSDQQIESQYTMTLKANGATLAEFLAEGWTELQLLQSGYMVKVFNFD